MIREDEEEEGYFKERKQNVQRPRIQKEKNKTKQENKNRGVFREVQVQNDWTCMIVSSFLSQSISP